MDIERFITIEDFLGLKHYQEGGTLMGGKRYARMRSSGELSPENQLKNLGKVNKTGEGIMDKVFFFEFITFTEDDKELQMVSAKVVDRYRFVSTQEALKEVALIKAKIKNREALEEEEKL